MADKSGTSETISWLELFFDLVVVVAIALLARELIADDTALGILEFVVCFVALWFTWTTFVLYVNVASEGTRVVLVLIGMFLVGVMAASVTNLEERSNVFVIAYLLGRSIATRASLRTGKVLAAWPAAQFGGSVAIWIASMWVPPPAKYGVWALALAFDIGIGALRAARSDTQAADLAEHLTQRYQRRGPERGGQAGEESERRSIVFSAAGIRAEHLAERLGLFVIIVLGEGVSQIVQAAAATEWAPGVTIVSVLAFSCLAGLWWLTFAYGFAGAPTLRSDALPPHIALPLHLSTTAALVAFSAGLGALVYGAGGEPTAMLAWMTAGALALLYVTSAVGSFWDGFEPMWFFGWAVPTIAACLALGALGSDLSAVWLVGGLAATIAWQLAYVRVARRRRA